VSFQAPSLASATNQCHLQEEEEEEEEEKKKNLFKLKVTKFFTLSLRGNVNL
jgi:hypothetical protein